MTGDEQDPKLEAEPALPGWSTAAYLIAGAFLFWGIIQMVGLGTNIGEDPDPAESLAVVEAGAVGVFRALTLVVAGRILQVVSSRRES